MAVKRTHILGSLQLLDEAGKYNVDDLSSEGLSLPIDASSSTSKHTLDSTIPTSSKRTKKVSTRIRPVDNTKISLTFSSFDVHTDQKRRAGSRRGVYFLTRN